MNYNEGDILQWVDSASSFIRIGYVSQGRFYDTYPRRDTMNNVPLSHLNRGWRKINDD